MAEIASWRIELEKLSCDLNVFQTHKAEGVTAISHAWVDGISMTEWTCPDVLETASMIGWSRCFHLELDFDVSGGGFDAE